MELCDEVNGWKKKFEGVEAEIKGVRSTPAFLVAGRLQEPDRKSIDRMSFVELKEKTFENREEIDYLQSSIVCGQSVNLEIINELNERMDDAVYTIAQLKLGGGKKFTTKIGALSTTLAHSGLGGLLGLKPDAINNKPNLDGTPAEAEPPKKSPMGGLFGGAPVKSKKDTEVDASNKGSGKSVAIKKEPFSWGKKKTIDGDSDAAKKEKKPSAFLDFFKPKLKPGQEGEGGGQDADIPAKGLAALFVKKAAKKTDADKTDNGGDGAKTPGGIFGTFAGSKEDAGKKLGNHKELQKDPEPKTPTKPKNIFAMMATKKADLPEGESKGSMFFSALKGMGKPKTPIREVKKKNSEPENLEKYSTGDNEIVPEKDVKVSGGLLGAKKRDSDKDMGGDGTKTPADGAKTPSNGKNLFEILGKKKGDLGEGESKGKMFMAALKNIGKPRDRSTTPMKK